MRGMAYAVTIVVFAATVLAAAAHGGVADGAALPDGGPKAAFVRSGELWVKKGGAERLLSEGDFIRNPRWSHDGNWLAYTRGENERELWLEEVRTGKRLLVSPEAASNFQWAPGRTSLAYQIGSQLSLIDLQHSERQLEVEGGIGNFSWLPDGSGFIASSEAKTTPEGWEPIRLFTLPLASVGDPDIAKPLAVLPRELNGMPVVGTSIFKWSPDGRRFAFLANPTASLSADSNTLCIMSAEGTDFRTIAQMVRNEQWFAWNGEGQTLAYIEGVGREATHNKRLIVRHIPSGASVVVTPAGYADRGFVWYGPERLVAVRAKDAEWSADPASRELSYLVGVSLKDGMQRPITPHVKADRYEEANPVPLPGNRLAWVRSDYKDADAHGADVIAAAADGSGASVWIAGIDAGTDYYGQQNWNTVLRFYAANGAVPPKADPLK